MQIVSFLLLVVSLLPATSLASRFSREKPSITKKVILEDFKSDELPKFLKPLFIEIPVQKSRLSIYTAKTIHHFDIEDVDYSYFLVQEFCDSSKLMISPTGQEESPTRCWMK